MHTVALGVLVSVLTIWTNSLAKDATDNRRKSRISCDSNLHAIFRALWWNHKLCSRIKLNCNAIVLAFVRRENFDSNIFDVNFLIIAKNRYNLFSEIMYLKSYSSSKLPSIPILTFLSSMDIWMPAAVWKPISARRFLDSGQVFVGPVKKCDIFT